MQIVDVSHEVPLRYLKMCFTTAQKELRGLGINRQTFFTAKLIFDLVGVAYYKAPTSELYKVGSGKRSTPCFDNL